MSGSELNEAPFTFEEFPEIEKVELFMATVLKINKKEIGAFK